VGYCVEKGTGSDKFGPVDRALWDWPRFLELLSDPARRSILQQAFDSHPLAIGNYVGGRFVAGGREAGWVGRIEGGELVLRRPDGSVAGRGWEGLDDALAALPPDRWHDLHIWREWPAAEAIAAGQPFAFRELVPVLLDLAGVYESVIGFDRGSR
jgi:hypothetical protein